MMTKHGFALAAALAVAACAASCSSTDQSSANKGNLRMALKASGTATAAATGGPVAADEAGGLSAANITISGASAKNAEGAWVPMQGSFPITLDVIALATSGAAITLPADIVPEGHYQAIQITISAVNLTLQDGTKIAITPPGTGWEVVIGVAFDVVVGQQTVINLNLRCDHSFNFLNGEFEFDPDIEVEGVEEHND